MSLHHRLEADEVAWVSGATRITKHLLANRIEVDGFDRC